MIKQIGLPLRGRPILLITRMITDRIGLHSVLLPLLIKGFSPSMAVNSYLNDNVEGKQFYFSFGSFSTLRSFNLDLKSRFNF